MLLLYSGAVRPPPLQAAPDKYKSTEEEKWKSDKLKGDVLLNFCWQDVGPRSAGPLFV